MTTYNDCCKQVCCVYVCIHSGVDRVVPGCPVKARWIKHILRVFVLLQFLSMFVKQLLYVVTIIP